jgi:DNA-directed RNA polymerase beta subunit
LEGEKIKSGQILTDGPAITSNELALGQNEKVGTCHGKVTISKMQFNK